MSNKSPKCPTCLKEKKVVQMFRLAGQPLFRCHVVGHIHRRDEFQDIDFHWHEKPKEWERAHNIKL